MFRAGLERIRLKDGIGTIREIMCALDARRGQPPLDAPIRRAIVNLSKPGNHLPMVDSSGCKSAPSLDDALWHFPCYLLSIPNKCRSRNPIVISSGEKEGDMGFPGHPTAISPKSEPSPGTWKGIVLAGGAGTRLYPTTRAVSKPLLPVYDKPMIYYPLSVLMQAGIRDILVITTPKDLPRFQALLEDGSQWGVRFSYVEQPHPAGIPDAFILGRDFIGNDRVCLILSDNIFHGDGLETILRRALRLKTGGLVFGYWVHDPHRYGVVEFNGSGKVIGIEEKPSVPKSNFAVTGLYLFDSRVVEIAARLVPSERGELEIIDVIREYLHLGELQVELLGGEITWMDAGTHESLAEACTFVEIAESRRGVKVACLEEVAYRMGYIGPEQVRTLAEPLSKNGYGRYLLQMVENRAS